VEDEARTSLVDFLMSAGQDPELQAAFWEASYDDEDPDRYSKFWDDDRIQTLLNRYGWRGLIDDHRRIIRLPRNLPGLQAAIEAELRGEAWSCDDFELHQHAHVAIGPCWVLVRV
jgi:hypothetical protein